MSRIFQQLRRGALIAIVLVLSLTWNVSLASAQPNAEELAKAVQEIEQLDAMRIRRASSLEGQSEEPTLETFKSVCKPVAMRAKQLSQENGWIVKQVADRYRNPAHAPSLETSDIALSMFQSNPQLIGFWNREQLDGQEGARYYRRIDVKASCLACHGAKESRPQFVKDRYPQDLAYGFNVDDLRGMYAVFIPDVKTALQPAAGLSDASPHIAHSNIRQLEEAPGQIVYQSRQKLYDQNKNIWQAIAFKRIRPNGETSLKLRLIGFPGTAELFHPHPLSIEIPGQRPLEADDVSDEPFTDQQPTGNVGQYDLKPILFQLPTALEIVLSIPTTESSQIKIGVSPLVVQEWQELALQE